MKGSKLANGRAEVQTGLNAASASDTVYCAVNLSLFHHYVASLLLIKIFLYLCLTSAILFIVYPLRSTLIKSSPLLPYRDIG